ncbi:MAG: tetratricopeptide repeat protein [Pseudomonadota bacterium]|nr:tetratricopeptide repeat protein [Pseudomonadota bacterium]
MHRWVLITAAALLAAGCAGAPLQQTAIPEAAPLTATPRAVPATGQQVDALLYNLLVGEIAGQRQQYGTSAAHYIAAARQSRDLQLARRAAQIALYAQETELAIDAANLWAELDPDGSDPYQVLAALHLQRGDREAAREPLRRLLNSKEFTSSEDYLELSRLFGHGADHRPLLTMMREVLAERPDDTGALYAYIVIAIRMGELDDAARRSAHLVALEPDSARVALVHAQLLNVAGDTAGSARFLADFVARNPQPFETRLALARLLVDQNQVEQARDHFQVLHDQDPGHADVLFALSLVELQTGELEAAGVHLRDLAKLEPDSDRAAYYLARLDEQAGRFESALAGYRAVKSAQYQHEAVLRGARLAGKLGHLDSALAWLHQTDGTNREQQIGLIVLEVDLLLQGGRAEEAVEVATTAIGTFPDDVDLLFSLGMAYEKLDDIDAMERQMRRVLTLEPQNAHALNALGYTFADRGMRLDEAREMIFAAHQLEPDNPFILDSLGWVEFRFGRYEAAIGYLKRALEILPDPEIYAHLGEVLWMMGEVTEARQILEQGLQQTPGDDRILGIIRKFDP